MKKLLAVVVVWCLVGLTGCDFPSTYAARRAASNALYYASGLVWSL